MKLSIVPPLFHPQSVIYICRIISIPMYLTVPIPNLIVILFMRGAIIISMNFSILIPSILVSGFIIVTMKNTIFICTSILVMSEYNFTCYFSEINTVVFRQISCNHSKHKFRIFLIVNWIHIRSLCFSNSLCEKNFNLKNNLAFYALEHLRRSLIVPYL